MIISYKNIFFFYFKNKKIFYLRAWVFSKIKRYLNVCAHHFIKKTDNDVL